MISSSAGTGITSHIGADDHDFSHAGASICCDAGSALYSYSTVISSSAGTVITSHIGADDHDFSHYYERQLETYERLKDKLQLALTAEMHTATLQGLAASGKRLEKKLAEITTLAEQGHIDITDQIQDFIQRQA